MAYRIKASGAERTVDVAGIAGPKLGRAARGHIAEVAVDTW